MLFHTHVSTAEGSGPAATVTSGSSGASRRNQAMRRLRGERGSGRRDPALRSCAHSAAGRGRREGSGPMPASWTRLGRLLSSSCYAFLVQAEISLY